MPCRLGSGQLQPLAAFGWLLYRSAKLGISAPFERPESKK